MTICTGKSSSTCRSWKVAAETRFVTGTFDEALVLERTAGCCATGLRRNVWEQRGRSVRASCCAEPSPISRFFLWSLRLCVGRRDNARHKNGHRGCAGFAASGSSLGQARGPAPGGSSSNQAPATARSQLKSPVRSSCSSAPAPGSGRLVPGPPGSGAPEDRLSLLGEGVQALEIVARVVSLPTQALDALVDLGRDGLVVVEDAQLLFDHRDGER